jgi:hypothetical protein
VLAARGGAGKVVWRSGGLERWFWHGGLARERAVPQGMLEWGGWWCGCWWRWGWGWGWWHGEGGGAVAGAAGAGGTGRVAGWRESDRKRERM